MASKSLKGPEAVLGVWISTLNRNKGVMNVINVPKSQLDIVEMGEKQGLIQRMDEGDKPFLIVGLAETETKENTMPPKKAKKDKQTPVTRVDEPAETLVGEIEAPVEAAAKKRTSKKSGAAKPVSPNKEKSAPGENGEKRGRKIAFPPDTKFKVTGKLPKKDDDQPAHVGARPGSARFLIRCAMLTTKAKNIGELKEGMEEQGVKFNNVDFRYLIEAGHVEV